MSAFAWALLLVIVGIFFLVLVFVIIRVLAANSQGTMRQTAGPHYSHEPKWFEYYRASSRRASAEPEMGANVSGGAPRTDNLPRCSNCGAATGFEQERCHKCGELLKQPRT